MQPVDDPTRLKENPNPKWAVPIELIELQPVYHQLGAQGEGLWGGWVSERGLRSEGLTRGGGSRMREVCIKWLVGGLVYRDLPG